MFDNVVPCLIVTFPILASINAASAFAILSPLTFTFKNVSLDLSFDGKVVLPVLTLNNGPLYPDARFIVNIVLFTFGSDDDHVSTPPPVDGKKSADCIVISKLAGISIALSIVTLPCRYIYAFDIFVPLLSKSLILFTASSIEFIGEPINPAV